MAFALINLRADIEHIPESKFRILVGKMIEARANNTTMKPLFSMRSSKRRNFGLDEKRVFTQSRPIVLANRNEMYTPIWKPSHASINPNTGPKR